MLILWWSSVATNSSKEDDKVTTTQTDDNNKKKRDRLIVFLEPQKDLPGESFLHLYPQRPRSTSIPTEEKILPPTQTITANIPNKYTNVIYVERYANQKEEEHYIVEHATKGRSYSAAYCQHCCDVMNWS